MTSDAGLYDELDLATAAVRDAGAIVRERFRSGAAVRFKSPEQPVTEADLLADDLLRERLLEGRPGYGWLSEETADSEERLERRRVWVVDPIDGTNSFVAGLPEFVVSVGLVEDGIPVVAAVYNPISEELYQALRGGGALRNGTSIRVADPPAARRRPTMLASRWEIETGVMAPYAEGWEISALGSTAYRMVKVAEGSAHAFVSPAWKHEWDVCGAALLVTEAGGVVTRGDGEPLRFNRPAPDLQGIIARASSVEVPYPAPARRHHQKEPQRGSR